MFFLRSCWLIFDLGPGSHPDYIKIDTALCCVYTDWQWKGSGSAELRGPKVSDTINQLVLRAGCQPVTAGSLQTHPDNNTGKKSDCRGFEKVPDCTAVWALRGASILKLRAPLTPQWLALLCHTETFELGFLFFYSTQNWVTYAPCGHSPNAWSHERLRLQTAAPTQP